MIQNKQDLRDYLRQDQIALGYGKKRRPNPFVDDVWRFQILMRKTEYHVNCARGPVGKAIALWYRFRYMRRSVKLGFSLPLNIFGPGLSIAHYGTLLVNSAVRVGRNCRLHAMALIGPTNGDLRAPILGDNVYVGPGAKLIGNIHIADNVVIGANAVVTRDITEPGTTWAGVPARKINDRGSRENLCADLFQ